MSLSTAQPGATGVTYTIGDGTNGFLLGTAGVVDGIIIQACTTPVAGTTCTADNSGFTTTPDLSGAGGFTLGANWTDTTAFTHDQTTNPTPGGIDCTLANSICLTRSASSAETTSAALQLTITGIQNPANANSTFFLRITTYSDATYTTAVDNGTVAGAVTQTLTVQAYVAEILQFCVGNSNNTTLIDDITTNAGTCGTISGNLVNFGVLDPTTISQTPVPSSPNNGNDYNGLAILRTNAANGSSVSYDAIQDGSGGGNEGSLKIQGVNCTSAPDSCITSAGTTQGALAFTAGVPEFGMTIAGVNCVQEMTYNSNAGLYTCDYTAGSEHLQPQSGYVGEVNTYCTDCTKAGTGQGYAWDDSGTSTIIASAAANKPVADEALVLKFAAESGISTTYGTYKVLIDYTAVATY